MIFVKTVVSRHTKVTANIQSVSKEHSVALKNLSRSKFWPAQEKVETSNAPAAREIWHTISYMPGQGNQRHQPDVHTTRSTQMYVGHYMAATVTSVQYCFELYIMVGNRVYLDQGVWWWLESEEANVFAIRDGR